MQTTKRTAAAAAVLALAAWPAAGTPIGSTAGLFELDFTDGAIPEDIGTTVFDPVVFAESSDSGTGLDSTLTDGGDLVGNIETFASVEGDAGSASAEASYVVSLLAENSGDAEETLSLDFDFALFSEVLFEDPATEFASAVITLDVLAGTESIFSEALADEGGLDPSGSESIGDNVVFDIPIAPGTETLIEVTLAATSEATASAIAPIPVPAGLPLLLAGLGALAVARGRRA